MSKILRSCNAYKMRGFAVMAIFCVALKQAFHRRKFTLLLSTAIIRQAIEPLMSKARRNVLIIDDSLFSRNRSKKVELRARIYDHVSGTYVRGFRMLTLGWKICAIWMLWPCC